MATATATLPTSLLSTLTDSPHTFLQPSLPLYTDALAYLKHALDPVAADVSSVQHERRQEARQKRKRGSRSGEGEILRLKQVHTDGFAVEQVWEQARRVIDAALEEAERGLQDAGAAGVGSSGSANGDVNGVEEEMDVDSTSSLGEEGVDYEVLGVDDGDEEWDSADDDEEELDGEDVQPGLDEDEDMDMDDEELLEPESLGNDEPAEEFVADKFGLNDGFFSIDDFNRKSEFLEQQDVRGDNDGAASDEEDVDWDIDPLGQTAGVLGNGEDGNESAEDENEDGPTFGDPDAPSEDEDDDDELDGGEMDGMGDMSNTNNIMYADFFAPPAQQQKKKKNKKGRPNPHNFPAKPATKEAEDEEVERTMAAVHRELFEDEEESSEEDERAPPTLDPSDPKSRRSAHERRKAALAEEIRKLEAANVAKRDWTLSGEARAADRPINSLLEEDLDFERTGKPVPVITAEVSESIEELIKRRILAHDFQDIPRRRPDDLATGGGKRGKLDFVLDDSRSKKGLAEEYEEEHLRRTDPNFVDVKDEKLRKEEGEVEALWRQICADLDGLSSWHFRPKQAAPLLEVRVDAPAISMEDARPSAGGAVAGASLLAPQELYRAEGTKEEVVGKSGLPAGREEMSRDERKRRRRREKERLRKGEGGGAGAGGKKGRDGGVVGALKKGGVKVIGKTGDVTDVEGKGVRDAAGGQLGGGRFKL